MVLIRVPSFIDELLDGETVPRKGVNEMCCDVCEKYLESLNTENEKLQNQVEDLELICEALGDSLGKRISEVSELRFQIEKERNRFIKDRERYHRATQWSDNKIAELEVELAKLRFEK